MPSFHFHLYDCGTLVEGDEGVMLADMPEAKLYALDAARDVIAGEARAGRVCLGCHIEIENRDSGERAKVLFADAVSLSGVSPQMIARISQ